MPPFVEANSTACFSFIFIYREVDFGKEDTFFWTPQHLSLPHQCFFLIGVRYPLKMVVTKIFLLLCNTLRHIAIREML